MNEVEIEAFKWGNIQLDKVLGLALDISHLEESTDQKIAGLIGFEILENFELFFDFKSKTIRIYNSKGQAVKEIKNYSNGAVQFDLKDFSSGVYFLKVQTENKTQSFKFIVTK